METFATFNKTPTSLMTNVTSTGSAFYTFITQNLRKPQLTDSLSYKLGYARTFASRCCIAPLGMDAALDEDPDNICYRWSSSCFATDSDLDRHIDDSDGYFVDLVLVYHGLMDPHPDWKRQIEEGLPTPRCSCPTWDCEPRRCRYHHDFIPKENEYCCERRCMIIPTDVVDGFCCKICKGSGYCICRCVSVVKPLGYGQRSGRYCCDELCFELPVLHVDGRACKRCNHTNYCVCRCKYEGRRACYVVPKDIDIDAPLNQKIALIKAVCPKINFDGDAYTDGPVCYRYGSGCIVAEEFLSRIALGIDAVPLCPYADMVLEHHSLIAERKVIPMATPPPRPDSPPSFEHQGRFACNWCEVERLADCSCRGSSAWRPVCTTEMTSSENSDTDTDSDSESSSTLSEASDIDSEEPLQWNKNSKLAEGDEFCCSSDSDDDSVDWTGCCCQVCVRPDESLSESSDSEEDLSKTYTNSAWLQRIVDALDCTETAEVADGFVAQSDVVPSAPSKEEVDGAVEDIRAAELNVLLNELEAKHGSDAWTREAIRQYYLSSPVLKISGRRYDRTRHNRNVFRHMRSYARSLLARGFYAQGDPVSKNLGAPKTIDKKHLNYLNSRLKKERKMYLDRVTHAVNRMARQEEVRKARESRRRALEALDKRADGFVAEAAFEAIGEAITSICQVPNSINNTIDGVTASIGRLTEATTNGIGQVTTATASTIEKTSGIMEAITKFIESFRSAFFPDGFSIPGFVRDLTVLYKGLMYGDKTLIVAAVASMLPNFGLKVEAVMEVIEKLITKARETLDATTCNLLGLGNVTEAASGMTAQGMPQALGECKWLLAAVVAVTGVLIKGDAVNYTMMIRNLSDFGRAAQGWRSLGDMVVHIFEYIKNQYNQYMHGKTTAQLDLEKKFPELTELFAATTLLRDAPMLYFDRSAELSEMCIKVFKKWDGYRMEAVRAHDLMSKETFGNIIRSLVSRYDRALQSPARCVTSRNIPTCLYMYGKPGTGKTILSQLLEAHIYKKYLKGTTEFAFDKCSWGRKCENEYWDGYMGQPIIRFDDMLQAVDTKAKPNPEFLELIRVVNEDPFQLHMSDITDKKDTYFVSDFVICTSNTKLPNPVSINDKNAFTRRLQLCVEVKVNPQYADAQGKVDQDKLKKQAEANGSNAKLQTFQYLIDIYDPDTGNVLVADQTYAEFLDSFDSLVNDNKTAGATVRQELNSMAGCATATPIAGAAKLADEIKALFVAESEANRDAVYGMPQVYVDQVLQDIAERIVMLRAEVPNPTEDAATRLMNDGTRHPNGRPRSIHDQALVTVVGRLAAAVDVPEEYHDAAEDETEIDQNVPERTPRPDHTTIVMDDDDSLIPNVPEVSNEVSTLIEGARKRASNVMGKLKGTLDAVAKRLISAVKTAGSKLVGFFVKIVGFLMGTPFWTHIMAGTISAVSGYVAVSMLRKLNGACVLATTTNFKQWSSVGPCMRCDFCKKFWKESRFYGELGTLEHGAGLLKSVLDQKSLNEHMPEERERLTALFIQSLTALTNANKAHIYLESHNIDAKRPRKTLIAESHNTDVKRPRATHVAEDFRTQSMVVNTPVYEDDKIVAQAGDSMAVDQWLRVTYNNCVRVESQGSGGGSRQNAVFVTGRILMTTNHFVSERGVDTFEVKNPGQGSGTTIRFSDCVIKQLTDVRGEKVDLAFIQLPKSIPSRPNIIKYFTSAAAVQNLQEGGLSFGGLRSVGGVTCVHSFNTDSFKLGPALVYPDMDGKLHRISSSLRYEMNTTAGDCGGLLYATNTLLPRKIVGVHVAGNKHHEGLAQQVSHEFIVRNLAAANFDSVSLVDGRAPFSAEMQAVKLDEKPVTDRMLSVGDCLSFGELPAPRCAVKSQIAKSAIHGAVTEPTMKPAHLRPFKKDNSMVDPMELGIKKVLGTQSLIPKQELEIAAHDVASVIESNDVREVLSFEEAIAGREGVYEPINRRTSPGYPYNLNNTAGGKKAWLGSDEEYLFDEEVRKDVEDLIDACRNNRRGDVVFLATLKDERRPIAKVDAGKTRVFEAAPMHFVIAMRMYFLAFIESIKRHRVDNEIAVGTNVYNFDWHKIGQRLDAHRDTIVAGDFSNFDGSLNQEILWKICDIINDWYGDSEENQQIRRVLWEEVCNTNVLVRGELIRQTHSQPSGNPMTVIINSIFNQIVMRMAYLICKQEAGLGKLCDFTDNVEFVTYGDDNILAISPEIIEWYNQLTITKALATFGLTYTDEAKTGELVPFRKLEECSFLKRAFERDANGYFRAPLDRTVVHEMSQWVKGSAIKAATAENVETSLPELALHGKEYYDTWAPKLTAACRSAGVKVKIPTFYEMEDELTRRLFGEI